MSEEPKKPRGFAALTPEQRKIIASKGGKSVKPENRTYSRYQSLASDSGKKGGKAVPPEKRTYYTDRDLASRAGSKGGTISRKNRDD